MWYKTMEKLGRERGEGINFMGESVEEMINRGMRPEEAKEA